jgi:hypothetical protein
MEAQKVKAGLVSPGELTRLKAGIRLNLSSSNSTRLNDLMSEFVETIREVTAASATCAILEQMIIDEANHRAQIVDESATIADIFSFSELPIVLPKIVRPDPLHTNSRGDSATDNQQLKEIQAALISIDIPRKGHELEREAALEIARGAEAEWNLRSVGTYSVWSEIQRLQRIVAEGEAMERKLAIAKEQEEQKLGNILLQFHQEEVDTDAGLGQAAFELKRQTQELDDQLAQLKLMVNEAAEQYDRICSDFNELDRRDRESQMPVETGESEEALFQFEEQDDNAVLAKQKVALEHELSELRSGFKQQKKLAKRGEHEQLLCIRRLKAKCKSSQQVAQQTLELNLQDASPIKRDIASIIERIDASLLELRQDLANE